MSWFRALAVLIVLSGCTTVGPSTTWDPHLPSVTEASASYEAGRTRDAVVMVRAMRTKTTSGTAHALGIIVARSDLNYPKIKELRSFGQRLPYRRLDRHRIGWLRAEVGYIPMSQREFHRLGKSGLTFRIYGTRRSYDATVPPNIFRNLGSEEN